VQAFDSPYPSPATWSHPAHPGWARGIGLSIARRFERQAMPARRGQELSGTAARVLPRRIGSSPRGDQAANGLVRARVCLNPVTNHAYSHRHSFRTSVKRFRDGRGANDVPAVTAAISGFGEGEHVAQDVGSQFSGAMRGYCVGLLPETATCGPIALPRDGDLITLKSKAFCGASDARQEFERRKRDWAPRETQIVSGMDWMFAQQARMTHWGAVGACDEGAKECHADIWG